jgi:hypothetical protein
LREIDLDNNKIEWLPIEFSEFNPENLHILSLHNNTKIRVPPYPVVGRGTVAILDYVRGLSESKQSTI